MSDVDYQRAGQVRQLLAERDNAVAYGDKTRAKQIDRRLADLGYVQEKPVEPVKSAAPQGRATKQAARQQTTAKSEGDQS